MIIKDKKKKKEMDKVPDKDRNGEPIFKIAGVGKENKSARKNKSPKGN